VASARIGSNCNERVYLIVVLSWELSGDWGVMLGISIVLRMTFNAVLINISSSVYEKLSNDLINSWKYCLLMIWKEGKLSLVKISKIILSFVMIFFSKSSTKDMTYVRCCLVEGKALNLSLLYKSEYFNKV